MTFEAERAKASRRPFVLLEIYLDYCQLTYGVDPCAAILGTTGAAKCFNTRATCQDSDNYDPALKVYRFCSAVADVPRGLAALPFITDVSFQPTKLSVSSGIGERGACTITMLDGKHNDRGIDKYVDQRAYDALEQGTFWGRFLARNRYFPGRKVVVYSGYLTKDAAGASTFDTANAEQRVYFLEKVTGPEGGRVTITAKDILKKADDARAVYPKPTPGRLASAIASGDGAATLDPAGVGDAFYSAAGKLRINGEVISFTRAGDALTLTARGQNFTTAAAHAEDDAVQECGVFAGQTLHEIAYEVLTVGAEIPAAFIQLVDWEAETDNYTNGRLYNAVITEPTGVNKLMVELSEMGPAQFWQDEATAEIIYRTLRPASSSTVEFDDAKNFHAGSVKVQTRQDLRISQVTINFGQRDPTEPLENTSNYQVSVSKIGTGVQAEKYGENRHKIINSRWLNASSRAFAEEIADTYLQRYDEAPRQLDCTLSPKDGDTATGDLFDASTQRLQGPDGLPESATFQAQSRQLNANDQLVLSAIEERFNADAAGLGSDHTILLSADRYNNYNLRTEHDLLYTAPTEAVTVVVTISEDTTVGGLDAAQPAFDIGDWPVGSLITVNLNGSILGKGGNGGDGLYPTGAHVAGLPGETGGTAIYTRFPATINAPGARIWAGGGGGGSGASAPSHPSGGGGGGGGADPGEGGDGVDGLGSFDSGPGADGTEEFGGAGGPGIHDGGGGGPGGDVGEDGSNGGSSTGIGSKPGGAGGPSGKAVDGLSYLTINGAPDIRGPQVN